MKTEKKELEKDIFLYTVTNGRLSFSAMNYGCTITNIWVPKKSGAPVDILLGYDRLAEWKSGTEAHNSIVGRVANRICGAQFVLDGKTYALEKNDGENCLHGGFNRFEKMLWQAEPVSDAGGAGVRFTRVSVAGEQGFPGNVQMTVTYMLTETDDFMLEYTATTDAPTPLNLTNHAYFNLNGAGNVCDHHLQLDCDTMLEIDSQLLPTGRVVPVAGTPFDFRTEKLIGKDIAQMDKRIGGGYDHCFVTHADETEVVRVGKVWSDQTGISVTFSTNQRGMQLYTGNFLNGVVGKGGVVHQMYDGVCFEMQRFPNAVNEPHFPPCILRPGERYWSKTIFSFK